MTRKKEQRLLTSLQVIKSGAAPAAAAPGAGFALQKRRKRAFVDVDLALTLRVLGVINDSELSAIVAFS